MPRKVFNRNGVIALVFFVFAYLLLIKQNNSPYDYLKKYTETNATTPNEFLYKADLGNKRLVIFYINKKNNLSCAIIKKTILSFKMIRTSSEILLDNGIQKADYLYSSFHKGKEWIDWGIVRDEKIKSVFVNDRKANLISIKGYHFRIYYLLGDNSEKIIPPNHILIDKENKKDYLIY